MQVTTKAYQGLEPYSICRCRGECHTRYRSENLVEGVGGLCLDRTKDLPRSNDLHISIWPAISSGYEIHIRGQNVRAEAQRWLRASSVCFTDTNADSSAPLLA